jgi:hypothetical protein
VKGAGDFQFDQSALDRDMRDCEASGWSLEKMVKTRRRQNRGSRLSARRVQNAISRENPEYSKLHQMATEGVKVSDVVPPDLEPTGLDPANWSKMRPTYKKAAHAVNKLLSEGFHKPGLAIILPVTALQRLRKQDRCNVFTSSWAYNTGKELGRPTADPRNLNGEHTKEAASRLWGKVKHPTIRLIEQQVNAYLAYCETLGKSARDCSLWKIDVKGAYTLQDYAIPDCALFMTELEGGYVLIYTCGCFGFAGQPMAFDIITRALRWELKSLLRGVGEGYVDDFFGITLTENLLFDMGAISDKIRSLLGEKAIAEKKSKKGKRIEIIVWDLDLEKQLITIGERCLQRALYGYITADEFAPMPLKQLQRLASWARRYGEINKLLLPFTTSLNNANKGKTNPHCVLRLGARAQQAIQMIRLLLLLTATEEGEFARPLESWLGDQPHLEGLIAEFDASLKGLGILWYVRNADGSERLVGVAQLDLRSLGFGVDAGNQNVAEYIATIVAVRGAHQLRDEGLLIEGQPPKGV